MIGITHSQTCLVLRGRLRALREAGFRVVLVASPGGLLDATAEHEEVEALPIPMERRISPLADLVSLFRLTRALFHLRPDMTEFSTPKAGLLGNLAALLCGVPRRIYLLRGLRLETASGLTRYILRVTEQVAAACSHIVLCNSHSLRDQAIALRLAGPTKLQVLGQGSSNGVDVLRFSPGRSGMRRALGIPEHAPLIGFVGRLTCDKGLPELIQAFDALLETEPSARLLLVGWFDESEDALSPELRAAIERHPKIVRTGFVSEPAPWYRVMDVLVLPTHREGFPNVALEAAASGIPVITTTATGARDAVVPGVTGMLVPPGDPNALKEALAGLLAHSERRRQMGLAARAWVVERFPQVRIHALTVALYRNLIQERSEVLLGETIRGVAAAAE